MRRKGLHNKNRARVKAEHKAGIKQKVLKGKRPALIEADDQPAKIARHSEGSGDISGVAVTQELQDSLTARNQYSEDVGRTDQTIIEEKETGQWKEVAQSSGKKLSTKQAKRLRKVLEIKEKKKKRTELLKGLEGFAMPESQATLMHRTSAISSKMTTKDVLLQQLKEQKAGIALSDKKTGRGKVVSLLVPRTARKVAEVVEESETDDSSDEDAAAPTAPATAAPPTPVALPAVQVAAKKEGAAVTGFGHLRRKKKQALEKGPASVYITVKRPMAIQEARLQLPILQEEHTIIDAVRNNLVTIICGETGSGKTTQVPQFLYVKPGPRAPPSAHRRAVAQTRGRTHRPIPLPALPLRARSPRSLGAAGAAYVLGPGRATAPAAFATTP